MKQLQSPSGLDRTKPVLSTQRIWFPIPEDIFRARMGVIDFKEIFFNLLKRQLGPKFGSFISQLPPFGRMIFAVERQHVNRAKLLVSTFLMDPIIMQTEFPLLDPVGAYAIPTDELDATWVYPGKIGLPELLAIAVRVSRTIKHEAGFEASLDINSPFKSLEIGVGQCFHRASNIVAAYRRNGVDARVTGILDLFDSGALPSDRCHLFASHWFVEASLDGATILIDSRYPPQFINSLYAEASKRGIHPVDLPAFVKKMFDEREKGLMYLGSEMLVSKIDKRVIAAEIDVLPLNLI